MRRGVAAARVLVGGATVAAVALTGVLPADAAGGVSRGSTVRADLVVGVSVATISPWTMERARLAGFSHVRHSLSWSTVDRVRGRYPWERDAENHLDNVLSALKKQDLRLVLRLDGGPRSADGRASGASPREVREFFRAVAARAFPTLDAIEVLNEPNLPEEWGGSVDPAGYARFLRAARDGVKSVTPDVWIIAGNAAPAPGGAGAVDDLEFVRAMYRADARGSFDALGIHNYGGNLEPERDPTTCGVCFRRAELYRQVMAEAGDAATPIWSTEMGWLHDTGRDLGDYNWMKVSADQQADYLVRSLRYASTQWPWMFGMLIFNLDHSAAPWHGPDTSLHWFALLNPDYSHRPAYDAVRDALR